MFTLRNLVLPPYHFVGRGLLRASNVVAAATPSTTPRRWNPPTSASAVAATEREEGTKKEIKLSVVNPGSAADLPPVTASRAGLTLWVGELFNLVATLSSLRSRLIMFTDTELA